MSPDLQENLKTAVNNVKELYIKSEQLERSDWDGDSDEVNRELDLMSERMSGQVDSIATMCGVPEDNTVELGMDIIPEDEWPDNMFCRDYYYERVYGYCMNSNTFEEVVESIDCLLQEETVYKD